MQVGKKTYLWRWAIYAAGLLLLSAAIALNTKTGLGISTTTSPSYAVFAAFGWDLFYTIFIPYLLMVAAQFVIKKEDRQWRDLLQAPVGLAFSALVDWFEVQFVVEFSDLWQKLLLMLVCVVLIGVGIAMMVDMQLIPNPPDGLVDAISRRSGRDLGLIKNFFDAVCVSLAAVIDLVFSGKLASVGVGTVCAMIVIGRSIALFNRLCKKKLQSLAGLL